MVCGTVTQYRIARIAKKIIYANDLSIDLEKNPAEGGFPAGKNRLKP
jgi:hypothetical protein